MKKLILNLFVFCCGALISQNTASGFFNTNEMVWYGLNFSEAKMIGQFDQAVGANVSSSSDIKNKWIPNWNSLVISEPQNFRLGEAFRKFNIYNDLGPTEKQNQNINLDNFMSFNPYHFADPVKTVNSVVSKLSTGEKTEGYGVIFIVEYFDKTKIEASVYVTVFDIKTKNVIISDKITGVPKGIGLRNFWAGAIKQIINQVNTSNYNTWAHKASKAGK